MPLPLLKLHIKNFQSVFQLTYQWTKILASLQTLLLEKGRVRLKIALPFQPIIRSDEASAMALGPTIQRVWDYSPLVLTSPI